MKRNRKKTFAYRPSDQVVSRKAIISIVLGAVGIAGYYFLILRSVELEGNADVMLGGSRMAFDDLRCCGNVFGSTKFS